MHPHPNPDFVPHWIDGGPHGVPDGATFDVRNPEDDRTIRTAAVGDVVAVRTAVAAAKEAFEQHRDIAAGTREQWLISAAEYMKTCSADVVELLVDEVGSPISKARREVATAVGVLRAAAGSVRRICGQTMPTDVPGRLSLAIREPLGVIASITPFNVPLIKGIKHTAMPLATGNSVVMLPSAEAPSVGAWIASMYRQCGVPDGLVNVVCGHGAEIGDSLTSHPDVQAIGFTGSTRVGRHIGRIAGGLGKRVTLEMGGKNPMIVLEDADLDAAVLAASVGAFLFQGQICMSTSRILVARTLFRQFVEKLTIAAESLGTGDLRDPKTMIGPIINQAQRTRIREHLADAIDRGATVCTGDCWVGNRCMPTILTEVAPDAIIRRDETFGPVTIVDPFDTPDEAIEMAGATPFGLVTSIFTADLKLARTLAARSNAGMVHINGPTIQEEAHVPFGGNGDSGFGRDGSGASIESLTRWKWITMQ